MHTLRAPLLAIVALAFVAGGCQSKPKTVTPRRSFDSSINQAPREIDSEGSLDRAKRGEPQVGGVIEDIYFDYDSSQLSSSARETLRQAADWLKQSPGLRIEIEGHCDERGTVEYNLALGQGRAEAVKDYLVALGVDRSQLQSISYGEEIPVCRDARESCWRRNRRAHFVSLR